jgi:hypothetical protein
MPLSFVFDKSECRPWVAYVYTKHQIKQEPEHNYWRETISDLSGAKVLHQKQKNQKGAGDADYY